MENAGLSFVNFLPSRMNLILFSKLLLVFNVLGRQLKEVSFTNCTKQAQTKDSGCVKPMRPLSFCTWFVFSQWLKICTLPPFLLYTWGFPLHKLFVNWMFLCTSSESPAVTSLCPQGGDILMGHTWSVISAFWEHQQQFRVSQLALTPKSGSQLLQTHSSDLAQCFLQMPILH